MPGLPSTKWTSNLCCHLRPKPGRHPYPNAPQSSWNASWTPQTRMENDWSQINICPFMPCLFFCLSAQLVWQDCWAKFNYSLLNLETLRYRYPYSRLVMVALQYLLQLLIQYIMQTYANSVGISIAGCLQSGLDQLVSKEAASNSSLLHSSSNCCRTWSNDSKPCECWVREQERWTDIKNLGRGLKVYWNLCGFCAILAAKTKRDRDKETALPHHPPASGLCKLKSHSLTSSPPLRDAWVRLFCRPLMQQASLQCYHILLSKWQRAWRPSCSHHDREKMSHTSARNISHTSHPKTGGLATHQKSLAPAK